VRAGRVPPGRRDAPVCMRRRRVETPLPTRNAAADAKRRCGRETPPNPGASRAFHGVARRRAPARVLGRAGREARCGLAACLPAAETRPSACAAVVRARRRGIRGRLVRSAASRREHESPAPRGTGLWWPYGLGRTGRPYAGFCPAACTAVTAISLGPTLPSASSGLPEDSASSLSVLCLTLLRARFTEQIRSPGSLVVSYTTVSPLPTSPPAVCSLWHCLADCSGWVLPTALLCGARTFLGTPGGVTRPSHRPVRSDECTGTPAPPGSDPEVRPVGRSRHPARRPPSGHETSVPHAENDVP